MTFDITPQEVDSFEGRFYRPIAISGPITLARFSDSGRGDRGRYGRFWLYGDYVAELAGLGGSAFALLKEIAQRWAICDDWGDKKLLTLMDVPPGRSVPAMVGKAKFQPKVSPTGGRATRRSYEGGALQLVIPVVDTDRNLDPTLALLVTRKTTTVQLLGNPARCLENPWVTAQRAKGANLR